MTPLPRAMMILSRHWELGNWRVFKVPFTRGRWAVCLFSADKRDEPLSLAEVNERYSIPLLQPVKWSQEAE